jgi:hypothetical protein
MRVIDQAQLLQRKAVMVLALQTVEILTPFATVFRYDDLPLEATINRQEWLSLLLAMEEFLAGVIAAANDPLDPP